MLGSRSFIKSWLAAWLWMLVIFLGSTNLLSAQQTSTFLGPFLRWLQPGLSEVAIQQMHHFIRKVGHVMEYAVLAVLLWRALHLPEKSDPQRWSLRPVGYALVLATLYAASDELHQSFVTSRSGSGWDVLLDTVGAALGLTLVWGQQRLRKNL